MRSVVPSLEVRAVASLMRRRELSPRGLLAGYRGVRDVSGLDARDPRPAVGFGVRQARVAAGALHRAADSVRDPERGVIRPLLKDRVPPSLLPAAKRLHVRTMPPGRRRALVAGRVRAQGGWCRALGSPLYATLLERAAGDVEAAGVCWRVLEDHPPTAPGADDALPLRLMGAVHRLVLDGRAPALARHYPSTGGRPDGDRTWKAFQETVADHREALSGSLDRPVQTNEVSRCPDRGLPARRFGDGPPAPGARGGRQRGLNLGWDRYRYEARHATWGDPLSPVRFVDAFADEVSPPLELAAHVAERRGCDASPLDPRSAEDRLTLESFVWPDQMRRMELLRSALEVAQGTNIAVERAGAPEWIEARLCEPAAGMVTVVFHSFVMQYLDRAGRDRFEAVLREAGARATEAAPLAWLRMEWGAGEGHVHLTRWPGGHTELIATAHNQGSAVRWLAGSPFRGERAA